MQTAMRRCCIIARDNNVVRVDFGREPDPPAPRFPGGIGLREALIDESAEPTMDIRTAVPRLRL